ncbi:universal stress protein [Dactylosporangium sp. AC04546]|uniref:universal stress protein n=1 Tax=Dactylosporangium sp. AC04546 TaxID=2862460 RepID=UPI001EDE6091|nr:universal stress protein [Dactylosporangium sp. AC04546]WVK79718.1 universal stress protein [Dactylosporangium sp. AC04546]
MQLTRSPIVVGVDGSTASLGAVRWAADEAARHGCTLRVVHAMSWEGPADGQGVVLDAACEARNWQPGIAVETATLGGPAAAVLQDQSRHASLVVIGGRVHDGGLLDTSVDAHLTAFAHCPVLVVNNAWRWADPMSAIPQKAPVVVGVDGSPSSQRALAFGYGEAAARHVPLVALHAGRARPHEAVAAEMEPWLRRHPEVETRFTSRDAPILDAMTEAARSALLVVLGAHRAGWYEHPRPNPVTQLIVHHAASPVLVTRSV